MEAWSASVTAIRSRLAPLPAEEVASACWDWISNLATSRHDDLKQLLSKCTSARQLSTVEQHVRSAIRNWRKPAAETER